jgi:hypothetical protein
VAGRFGGCHSLVGMHLIGAADVDDLHAIVPQNVLEAFRQGALQAELVGQCLSARSLSTADRHDLHVRVLEPAGRVCVGHVAYSVNGDAQFA